jgi:hypothetical protein
LPLPIATSVEYLFSSQTFFRPGCSRGFSLSAVYFYLDRAVNLCYKRRMNPRLYTTREVAKRAGVSRQTLQAWIVEKRVSAPAIMQSAGVRLWTERDVAEVLKVKPRDYPRGSKRKNRG